MLIIFTLLICIIAFCLKVDPFIVYFFYIISLTILKGILTKEFRDVFNLRSSKKIYEKVGLKDSVISLISYLIMTIFYFRSKYDIFTVKDIFIISLIFIFFYRFMFWGISSFFNKRITNN